MPNNTTHPVKSADGGAEPFNRVKNEEEILKFWREKKIFEKSVEGRPATKPYVFYDGPPFATGLPHYGHILSSVIKDVVPRYKTMRGYSVRRRWGWDCHGLPIENLIEKKLKISGKKEIEKISIAKFNQECEAAVLTYTKEWKKMVERIGRWVEFDNAYKTMDPAYIESVWWALKTIWDKNLIYKGYRVLMYCPRCETPISKAEVAMDNSYKTVSEEAITVKFQITNYKSQINSKLQITNDKPTYILAWTTTPWTLPSNVALAVGKDIRYWILDIEEEDENYIIAADRVEKVMGDKKYKIIKKIKGSDLVGLEYEPIFPYFKDTKNAFRVVAGDFVTTEDGTGVVHIAPAFGEDDYNLGQKEGMPLLNPVDDAGRFTAEVADYAGQNILETNKQIIKDLGEKIVKKENHEHDIPHCWRCETKLFYKAINAWFINIQKIKPRLKKLNEKINWYPPHLKHGRFLNILEEAPDWNISRNRYWATPLPFWQCEKCGENTCVGSVKELKEKAANFGEVYKTDVLEKMDLHKHNMDKIRLKCEKCGGTMSRIPEVIDCWVESASMPFAEYHYPFENAEVFKKRFPGQYVAEYIAQTRAWFYYMHAIAALLFDDISFENVVTTGTILNEKGEKLSKSKMNYTDPWEIINMYGVDALRFYLMTSVVMHADNLFFNDGEVKDIYNKVINLLQNTLTFYKTFAGGKIESDKKSTNVLDKWILAKLKVLLQEVTLQMDNYDTVKAGRPIKDFINDLSTWYIRRSRDRFKGEGRDEAAATLRYVLLTLAKIMAPLTPFIAEQIYQELGGELESVHLEDWPEIKKQGSKKTKKQEDEEKLLIEMESARKVVEAALSIRKEKGIKVRQPLSELQITNYELRKEIAEIIAEEINVHSVIPAKHALDRDRGAGIPSSKEWVIKDNVALNTTITPELREEGAVRELTRAVNALRKEAGLTPNDKITLYLDPASEKLFKKFQDEISKSTVSGKIVFDKKDLKHTDEVKLDDGNIWIGIEK